VISAAGFFCITGAAFGLPPNIYNVGAPSLLEHLQFSCHSVTASWLQTVQGFFGTDAPIYTRYLLWLEHGLQFRWQPPTLFCDPTPDGVGLSMAYLYGGITVWIMFTATLVVLSLKGQAFAGAADRTSSRRPHATLICHWVSLTRRSACRKQRCRRVLPEGSPLS
jgi:hypothetical protein